MGFLPNMGNTLAGLIEPRHFLFVLQIGSGRGGFAGLGIAVEFGLGQVLHELHAGLPAELAFRGAFLLLLLPPLFLELLFNKPAFVFPLLLSILQVFGGDLFLNLKFELVPFLLFATFLFLRLQVVFVADLGVPFRAAMLLPCFFACPCLAKKPGFLSDEGRSARILRAARPAVTPKTSGNIETSLWYSQGITPDITEQNSVRTTIQRGNERARKRSRGEECW